MAIDLDDPNLTVPLPRYNAMLAVLRNTLYMYVLFGFYNNGNLIIILDSYGGIYERGSREYTLDDFHSLQLDKLERYVCLKESGVVISEGDGESSSSDDDDDDDDEDERDDEDDEEEGIDGDEDEELEKHVLEEENDIKQQTDTEKVSFLFSSPLAIDIKLLSRLTSASKPQHLWVSQKMLHDLLKM